MRVGVKEDQKRDPDKKHGKGRFHSGEKKPLSQATSEREIIQNKTSRLGIKMKVPACKGGNTHRKSISRSSFKQRKDVPREKKERRG